jgi:hypothetical protein
MAVLLNEEQGKTEILQYWVRKVYGRVHETRAGNVTKIK